MLEQVGKTALTVLFILGSHFIPQIHRHNRRLFLLQKNNLQTILQFITGNLFDRWFTGDFGMKLKFLRHIYNLPLGSP